MNKFELGDRVYVNDLIGKITDIETHVKRDRSDRQMKYRYEVTYDVINTKDWFDEDEIEPFVEKTCEASNNNIQDSSTRPCLYLEDKATFHRWVDETKLIMKFDATLTTEKMWELKHTFNDIGMVPASVNVIPVTSTFALIEVSDGSVKKVPPEEIRFVKKR